MTSARRLLARLLRNLADRVDRPRPLPQPPDAADFDLTAEEDAHRSEAALGLLDKSVLGWLLIELRSGPPREQGGLKGSIKIHGFVPKYSYAAFVATMNRVIGALER
jgi:hypothetical protein